MRTKGTLGVFLWDVILNANRILDSLKDVSDLGDSITSGLPYLTNLVNSLPFARTSACWVVSQRGSISNCGIGSRLEPVPRWCGSAVESYPWSPSHDQRGMLRPFGTSSAERW